MLWPKVWTVRKMKKNKVNHLKKKEHLKKKKEINNIY